MDVRPDVAPLASRPTPPPAELAARIRRERERLGLTQEQAAARLGVGRRTYRQLASSANPRTTTLVGLVRGLGMRPGALLPELFAAGPRRRHNGQNA